MDLGINKFEFVTKIQIHKNVLDLIMFCFVHITLFTVSCLQIVKYSPGSGYQQRRAADREEGSPEPGEDFGKETEDCCSRAGDVEPWWIRD